jgi:predicted lysophospholipase L1 biosynthesis ABC-type transport system permease subunit
MIRRRTMFDRAHVDSTGRTAAGPLNHYSQTETAVWSGGANLAAAKVALSGVAWCLALGWLDYGQGIAVWPILALALGLVVMGLTLLLLVMSKQNDD